MSVFHHSWSSPIVVVALQEGVEIVVVAAGALHAGAEEDVAGGVGDVVQDILPLAASVAIIVFVDPPIGKTDE
jgi:hypothetical protein